VVAKNIPIRHIKATQNESDFFASFSIRELHDLLAGKDMIQEIHRHDYFFILALKKGNGNHEIDFTSYRVGDHSVFFMRPGQVHRLSLTAGSKGYLIEFKTDFYHPQDKLSIQLLRKAGHKNYRQFDPTGFKKLQDLFTIIFQEYTNKQENYQEVIKANLGIFFIELSRRGQPPINGKDNINYYSQERLEEFLELIETRIAQHKQVSDYAEILNLSPFQLNAITKATLGKTGSELINEFIILEAKRYLLATSNQITQIAYQLGYEDVSYFIRFFKKRTGLSPEVFRRNFK
jgi:AraC family transcriptional activator of pobA